VIPLHAMEAHGVRGGIAPTHSLPRHYMGVSGQHHAPAALTPGEKTPGTHCAGGWVGPRAGLDAEARGKISAVSTSETSVNFYHTTLRYNSEDSHLYARRRENLKSFLPIFCTSRFFVKHYQAQAKKGSQWTDAD
jgi:hypothetical protein